MRRRVSVALLAGVLLAGLVAAPGALAGAQDIADLPRLGFEINPDRGNVGDLVEGQVDPDDVQDNCFDWLPSGQDPVASLAQIWSMDYAIDVLEGFGGAGPFYFGEERLVDFEGNDIEDPVFQAFYRVYLTFAFAMAWDVNAAETFFSAMFPITFVDPVTQDLLGDMGAYDPFTGEGSVEVPDLAPGLYAVAAACMFPEDAESQVLGGGLDDAFAAFSAWAAENYPDSEFPEFHLFVEDWHNFTGEAAPVMLAELVRIQAIGIDFYCILQDDGSCATPPEPVGLIDDGVLDEFNGDRPSVDVAGPGAEDLDEHADVDDSFAVQATPSFTG